ncbi:c-opsin, partial [Asbolus verrucosus]
ELLIPAEGYIVTTVVLFFVGFLGFVFNLSVIVFMSKKRELWTPSNAILFNLAVSDFLVSVLGNPWTFTATVSHKWIFRQKICILYGFTISLSDDCKTTLDIFSESHYTSIDSVCSVNWEEKSQLYGKFVKIIFKRICVKFE